VHAGGFDEGMQRNEDLRAELALRRDGATLIFDPSICPRIDP